MKKRLLAALMAGAMALSMAAFGGSDADSGTAGSFEVGVSQLQPPPALAAATPGCPDQHEETIRGGRGPGQLEFKND